MSWNIYNLGLTLGTELRPLTEGETSSGAEKIDCCTGADIFAAGLANVERAFSHKVAFGVNCWQILHANMLMALTQTKQTNGALIFIEQEEHFLNSDIFVFLFFERERKKGAN